MQELKKEHKMMVEKVQSEAKNKIERVILADSDSIEKRLSEMEVNLPPNKLKSYLKKQERVSQTLNQLNF